MTNDTAARLRATQEAFDSVAADYDGPRGNNESIRDMRAEMWRWLDATFAPGSRLIDLGCGTGLDAVRMAKLGHQITATDWSPQMVERTRERAAREEISSRVSAVAVGAHELQRLEQTATFDGAYSNLGPLNCIPDLGAVSRECSRLLKPGGILVFTVIGRICPWEFLYYALKGRWSRARIRFHREMVAVGMNQRTIWTRYYTPREFFAAFKHEFFLQHCRAVCLLTPPPYLSWLREHSPRLHAVLWRVDRWIAGWPLLRNMGDHFLIVMRRRPERTA